MHRGFLSAAIAAASLLFYSGAGATAAMPIMIEKAALPPRTVRHVRPTRNHLRGRSKTYRFTGTLERARRVRQIHDGQLTTANGLVLTAV